MKPRTTEMIKGPEAFENFKNAMRAIVAVPHDVIKARIEEDGQRSSEEPKPARTEEYALNRLVSQVFYPWMSPRI